jgi:hypothetical protein
VECSGTRVKDIKFVTGVEDITDLNFLAHIAKGNDVSFKNLLFSFKKCIRKYSNKFSYPQLN